MAHGYSRERGTLPSGFDGQTLGCTRPARLAMPRAG